MGFLILMDFRNKPDEKPCFSLVGRGALIASLANDFFIIAFAMDSTSPTPPHPTPESATLRPGRRRDPAWQSTIVEDNIVSCVRCEKIIHTYGMTHVERVRHHLEKTCRKRFRLQAITSFFPVAPAAETITNFEHDLSAWAYSTGFHLQ